jgi:hypothetical protein
MYQISHRRPFSCHVLVRLTRVACYFAGRVGLRPHINSFRNLFLEKLCRSLNSTLVWHTVNINRSAFLFPFCSRSSLPDQKSSQMALSYVYAISRRNPPDSRMLMSSIRLAQRHMPNRFVFGFQHVEKYMYLVSAHICRSTSQSDHSKKIPIFSEHLPPLSNPNSLQRDLQETPKMHSKTLLTVFALATAVAAIPVPNSGSTESLGQEISDVFGSPFGNGTKPWGPTFQSLQDSYSPSNRVVF